MEKQKAIKPIRVPYHVFGIEGEYYLCPRCGAILEEPCLEYVEFCKCGTRIDWRDYINGECRKM